MANKRVFKKSVDALSSAIVDEMMASYYNEKEANRELISSAIAKVLKAMQEAKIETNKMFDKGVKDFDNMGAYNVAKMKFNREKYDKAIENFNNSLGEAMKDYNEAMPKNSKEA